MHYSMILSKREMKAKPFRFAAFLLGFILAFSGHSSLTAKENTFKEFQKQSVKSLIQEINNLEQAGKLVELDALLSHLDKIKFDNQEDLHRLNYHKAMHLYKKGAFKQSYDSLQNLYNALIEFNDATTYEQETHILVLIGLGKYLQSIGENVEANMLLQKAFAHAEIIDDVSLQISANYNRINVLETLGEYPNALELAIYQKELAQTHNDSLLISGLYSQIGSLYLATADTIQAIYYHSEALKIREKIGYREGIAKSQRNLATIFELQGFYQKAENYYLLSLEICKSLAYQKGLVKSLTGLGRLKMIASDFKTADSLFYLAYEKATKSRYEKGIIELLSRKADIQLHYNKIDSALVLVQSAIRIATNSGQSRGLSALYKKASSIYESRGEHNQALVFFKKYAQLEAELFNFDKNQQIARIETDARIRTQNKENTWLRAQNAIHESNLKKNRLITIILILCVLILFSCVGLVVNRNRIKQRALEFKQLTNDRIEAQNQQLTSLAADKDKLFGIISHELRNPLWWFRHLVEMLSEQLHQLNEKELKATVRTLQESANQAFHLTDNLLNWAKLQLKQVQVNLLDIALYPIIEQSHELYLSAMKMKNIQLINQVSTNTHVYSDYEMSATMIRNLISNAVKYSEHGNFVRIFSNETETTVELVVENNGKALNTHQVTLLDQLSLRNKTSDFVKSGAENGLGLLIIRELAELTNASFKYKRVQPSLNHFSLSWPKSTNEIYSTVNDNTTLEAIQA